MNPVASGESALSAIYRVLEIYFDPEMCCFSVRDILCRRGGGEIISVKWNPKRTASTRYATFHVSVDRG